MMKTIKMIKTMILRRMGLCLSIFLVLVFMNISNVGCPIRYLTGIPCLGCGMTRACLCLLRFDFAQAFYFHPLCYFMPVVVMFYLLKEKMGKTILIRLQWMAAILFAVVYVVRVLDPGNMLITINVSDGLLYKIAHSVI